MFSFIFKLSTAAINEKVFTAVDSMAPPRVQSLKQTTLLRMFYYYLIDNYKE